MRLAFVLAIVGCSGAHPIEPPKPVVRTRECLPPVVRSCSKLAVVTPREPTPSSSAYLSDPFLRGDGIETVQYGLLQHFTIRGTPPRLRATWDAALDPGVWSVIASDGEWLFECNGTDDLVAYDASNTVTARIPGIIDPNSSGCSIEAFRGVAMTRRAGRSWEEVFYDAAGHELLRQPTSWRKNPIHSYGCGFLWSENPGNGMYQVDFMPFDGRPPASASIPSYTVERWPYDTRSVAALGFTPACSAQMTIIRDDGQTVFSRCIGAMSAPKLFEMSFGAVLHFGNGVFQIVDVDGSLVGDPLAVAIAPPPSHLGAVVHSKDFIALTEQVRTDSSQHTDYYQTVIGCAR